MTYFELKNRILSKLTAVCGEFSRFEALCILRSLCSLTGEELLLHSRDEASFDEKRLEEILARRISGEPLAYILGETFFYGRRFAVSPTVLIPRADTEFVVEQALEAAGKIKTAADLCTGSGAIAVTLAAETGADVFAVDISEEALATARRNAEENGVGSLVSFLRADVRSPFLAPDAVFDLIISNPPYIRSAVVPTLSEEVQREPALALDGGKDGLDFYRSMLSYLPEHIKESGTIVFEIGYDQKEALEALAREKGLFCTVRNDYGGNPRAAVIKKKYETR